MTTVATLKGESSVLWNFGSRSKHLDSYGDYGQSTIPQSQGRLNAAVVVSSLKIVISNQYPSPDLTLYPWEIIVEPYRKTLLSAVGGTAESTFVWTVKLMDEGSAFYEKATINDHPGSFVSDLQGREVEVMFTDVAELYIVTLTEYGKEGDILRNVEAEVMCKYVRRELRELTQKDRERFFDALEVYHRVDLDKGRALYGDFFVNYESQTRKHLAKMTLDGYSPFHNGQVFITAHFAFARELELGLQAVDPSIALPYWEYTLDKVLYGSNWQVTSPIFSNAYFGAYPQEEEGVHTITTGRWAYLPIPKNFSMPERNAYGRLTDSVNPDPSGFVGRSKSMCGLETKAALPGCKELWGVIQSSSLDQLHGRVEFGYHGMLHSAVGGYWDCPYSMKEMAKEHPKFPPILEAIAIQANTLWRTAAIRGLTVCPHRGEECQAWDRLQDCSCTNPDLDKLADDELGYHFAYGILLRTSILDMLSANYWLQDYITTSSGPSHESKSKTDIDFSFNLPEQDNKKLIKWLVRFVSHPGKMAPFATPLAATNDPLFGPSHSAYLRLYRWGMDEG
ncbi:unnamed protein product [Choristocarpus tenellus]